MEMQWLDLFETPLVPRTDAEVLAKIQAEYSAESARYMDCKYRLERQRGLPVAEAWEAAVRAHLELREPGILARLGVE